MRENAILASGFKCPSGRQEMAWWKGLPIIPQMNKNFDAIKESVGQPDRYALNLFFSDSRLEYNFTFYSSLVQNVSDQNNRR
ncbi:hypothetical protein HZS_1844 [Henneguya salminicola]|nr:hypothetical protein HZS_1844 [Henneguya salminicola]